jgi:hydrogenase expression/formation protein HypE
MSAPHVLPPGKIPADLLADLLGSLPRPDERVRLGPATGHDSAAISFGERTLVAKSDPITFPTDRPAHHLVHVNANDIACQGGVPKWLLVTALFPEGTTADVVRQIFSDLVAATASLGVTLIGGHTEVTHAVERPIYVGTMLGEVASDRLVRPADGRPGDRLLMTRSAGIEGTAILAGIASRFHIDPTVVTRARAFLDDPGISVLPAAAALHAANTVSVMHDPTEGGIATAVREMAAAAGTGLLISRDAIPVAPETDAVARAVKIDPLGLLASGSLLAAVPRDRMASAEEALQAIGLPFAWIGKLTDPAGGMRMREGATEVELPEFAVDELARVLREESSS